ncbi:MAG: hypothetical protein R3C49_16660 [Planctomycetaceae bacterium]
MKVEDCIVSVERRTIGGCIDLAFVFAKRFAGPLLSLTACFAVPSTLLVWLISSEMRHDVMLPSAIIFGFFSMLASGAIVATVGPQVFGVPMSVRAALKGLLQRSLPYIFLGTLARMTGFCVVVPLLPVMAWCGHLPEVMFLERSGLNSITQRLSWLCKGGGFSRNLGRILTLTAFWALAAFGLFMVIDVLSGLVFNLPILFGTIAPGPDLREAFLSKLFDDPAVMTMLQVCLWLTYPIVRLAWFFCYLDQRIRNECWDLELQFRTEAIRLEEQPA